MPLQRRFKLFNTGGWLQPFLLSNIGAANPKQNRYRFLYLCCSFLFSFALLPLLIGHWLNDLSVYWPILAKANWLVFVQQVSIPLTWLLCFAGLRQIEGAQVFRSLLGLGWAVPQKQRLLQTLHLLGLQTLMTVGLFALFLFSHASTFKNPLNAFHGLLYWGFALLVVFVSPLMEELIFRGWLQGQLNRCFSPAASIFITAMLFTCLHVAYRDNGLVLGYVFCLGLLYGLWRWHYGSIWPCVLAHTFNNALALLLSYFALS